MKEFLYYWNSFTDVNATIHVQSNSDVYKVDIFNILGFLMFVCAMNKLLTKVHKKVSQILMYISLEL